MYTEDATCQTELLINSFPSQRHIRESSSLRASSRPSFGFRFACMRCMHAVHACMQCVDMYMKTLSYTKSIGLLGSCSEQTVDRVSAELHTAAADSAAVHAPGPWDPAHARCCLLAQLWPSLEPHSWDPNWCAWTSRVPGATSPSLPSPLKLGSEWTQDHLEHQDPPDLHVQHML